MPTLSAPVPDDWEFSSKFKSLVEAKFSGKPGRYIKELIEKDLNGAHEVTSNTTLIDLIRQFRPGLLAKFSTHPAADEPISIDKLIDAIDKALDTGLNLGGKYFIVTEADFLEKTFSSERFWQIMRDHANSYQQSPDTNLKVAEDAEKTIIQEINRETSTPPAHTPIPTPPKPRQPAQG